MANSKKCMIIGASPLEDGKIFNEFKPENYFVICADAGYETAEKYGITPNYIVGDFDSAKQVPKSVNGCPVKVLPVEKDATDTMFAAYIGLKLGYKDFVLVGCLGGTRYDHSIANFNVMLYICNKGGDAVMADNKSRAFLLRGRRLRLSQMVGSVVSVFPFGTNTCNLSYKGLKYPLHEEDLRMGDTLMGISNEVTEEYAEIEVNAGSALAIIYI